MSRGYGLTDSEKKEVNKNTRAAQQSLMHKRRNIKSVAKNNLAGLGGAVLGAGLGYGALKGAVGMAGARSAIKGAKLSRKLNKQKVFNSIEEYKDMVDMASTYKEKAKLNRDAVKSYTKLTGAPIALTALGGMSGGISGTVLKGRSDMNKFMKERYGDNHKPTIKQNEVDRVLAKREKSASAMIDEYFEKVALFGLGKNNKSNPNSAKETWIDGVDAEDYDKHVNAAKSVYSKAKANNHLTQSGLNALEQSNAEGSTPFQWIGSRDFTDGNADTYINEYRSLMNKSACDIVEESFDKVAFNLGAVAKTVGNGIKSMAVATKNLPNSIGNVKKLHNFATNTNLSQSTRGLAATARNKQIGNVAKGMALPAMGVAGAGMIGAGVNNALHNNNEKTAFDIVNDSFEKVARRYC